MRISMLAVVTAVAANVAAMPAQAAWKNYVNREFGIAFAAPGEVKTGVGNFRGNIAGPRQSIVYRSAEDNIEYKVTVMSFVQAQAEGATILGEREFMFQARKKTLSDTFARVGAGADAVYGRKLVVELPDNKGRSTGAFYFNKGRLIALEATVLPGRGNPATPDIDRFVNSISFAPANAAPGAIELTTPPLD